ncbi:DUF6114 domain-containing protein, partial [Micromonospora arida]
CPAGRSDRPSARFRPAVSRLGFQAAAVRSPKHIGPQGLAAYLVPTILVICGVLLITAPQQRVFYAVVSLVLGLVSWLTSNLGGFVVGMLLALLGGALAFAWTPDKDHPATGAPTEPAKPASPEDENEDAADTMLLPGMQSPDPSPADRG